MAGYNILYNHHDHFTLYSHTVLHMFFVISGVYVISECARPLTGPRLERTVAHGCVEVPPRFGVWIGFDSGAPHQHGLQRPVVGVRPDILNFPHNVKTCQQNVQSYSLIWRRPRVRSHLTFASTFNVGIKV